MLGRVLCWLGYHKMWAFDVTPYGWDYHCLRKGCKHREADCLVTRRIPYEAQEG